MSPCDVLGNQTVLKELNGHHYSNVGVSVVYHEQDVVQQLVPSSGGTWGATLVVVHGGGFHNFMELVCKFGGGSLHVFGLPGGSNYKCRFGQLITNASYVARMMH